MTKPLRILTVANVPPDPNSGAAGTVYFTNVAFRELGHEVDEIWNDELPQKIEHGNLHGLLEQPRNYWNAISKRLESNSYDVIQISQPQGYFAAKMLKKKKFQGIVTNRSHGLELRVNAIVPKWNKKLGVQESTFPRSLLTPVLRSLMERQWPKAVRYSDGVIVTCELDREFLSNRVRCDDKKIRTIHHGIPDSFLETLQSKRSPEQRRKILYVGQHSFIKGPHLLVEILNSVLEKHSDISMTWVTAESAHSWISEQLKPNLRDQVQLLPWCDQSELISLYDSHGILLFPSFFEGAGKASLEAMSRGLCVVATDTGGMHDYIIPSQNGFLCEVGNTQQFDKTLCQILSNPNSIVSNGEAAFQTVKDYSWKRCAQEAINFYYQLMEKS